MYVNMHAIVDMVKRSIRTCLFNMFGRTLHCQHCVYSFRFSATGESSGRRVHFSSLRNRGEKKEVGKGATAF